MLRLQLLSAALLAMVCASLLFGLHSFASDDAGEVQKPVPVPSQVGCLPEPLHWSSLPEFAQGVELVLTRYLRFETPDGRTINARMFLTEFHPKRVDFGDDAPADVLEKRRALPSRMACIGHEIAVDDAYEPDFDVPSKYVKQSGMCAYTVDLGAVQCFIRTTDLEAK